MFGYIMANNKTLTKEENNRYQEMYCGLCKTLHDQYGITGRMTLTYDMTFLSILLASLYNEPESSGIQKCPMHPFRSHRYSCSAATAYAADLSVILAYFKCLDDWNDDHSVLAHEKSKALKKHADIAAARWPQQYIAIERGISDLTQLERHNEMNPDKPANCFGIVMGELFVRENDKHAATLRKFGAALGRFIYMIDAVNDLRADIKKERYNPLISIMDIDFTQVLTLLISECTKEFETLPLNNDAQIMRNILYSGVWSKYSVKGGAE